MMLRLQYFSQQFHYQYLTFFGELYNSMKKPKKLLKTVFLKYPDYEFSVCKVVYISGTLNHNFTILSTQK